MLGIESCSPGAGKIRHAIMLFGVLRISWSYYEELVPVQAIEERSSEE